MEYITSENVVSGESVAAGAGADVESGRVRLTVERLLSRLGLSQLTSLVVDDDELAHVMMPDVHVIGHADDSELREAGRSLAVLLQLLRHCTNWDELVSDDASLLDALVRLTEHEFSGGTMGYGVHTQTSVDRLAGMLTVDNDVTSPSVDVDVDVIQSHSDCRVSLTARSEDVTRWRQLNSDDLTAGHRRRRSVQTSSDTDCRLDMATAVTSCSSRRPVDICCHVDTLSCNSRYCDSDDAVAEPRLDDSHYTQRSPVNTPSEN